MLVLRVGIYYQRFHLMIAVYTELRDTLDITGMVKIYQLCFFAVNALTTFKLSCVDLVVPFLTLEQIELVQHTDSHDLSTHQQQIVQDAALHVCKCSPVSLYKSHSYLRAAIDFRC